MQTLPEETLLQLYAADFAQISTSGQHTRNYAVKIFSMMLCAQEPLSPKALIQATARSLSQETGTTTLDALLHICCNLVVLDSQLNVLRFIHASFQEFLATKPEFAQCSSHSVAALSCLDACLEGLPTDIDGGLSPRTNFYQYSTLYWPEHCRLAMVNGLTESVASKMREFVFEDGDIALTFVGWMEDVRAFTKMMPNDHAMAKELDSVIHSGCSPLFTACVFGIGAILDELAMTTQYDWNQTNDLGQSGLYLAAATGREIVVRFLLQHEGVNVNAMGGKFDYALHAACFGGHAIVVKLLLDNGAQPKLGPKSALEYALLADHEDIALLLLAGYFEISHQIEFDSVLRKAAEAGFAEVTQALQKKYAPLYGGLGSPHCKAVQVAILKGRTGVVERYMQKLEDLKAEMAKDALATAALGGQDKMIRLLLEKGLDPNEEGVLGTPLRAASIKGHESTVKLLLSMGASLHIAGSFGEPLQAAAMRGHESIVRTLLSQGADVNSKGGLYGTALQAAAYRGHKRVAELLLSAGAHVYASGFARDAFHAALEGGHAEIATLLDASPSRALDKNHTPKYQSLAIDTMQSYRDPPPGSDFRDHDKVPLLRAAAAKGHVTVVRLLLSRRVEMDISENEIIAALKEACEKGHEAVANQLLYNRVQATDFDEALEAAALQGHLKVVDLLIDYEERLGLVRVESVRVLRLAINCLGHSQG